MPILVAPYCAILGLLGAALTANVIINRVRSHIDAGDGGDRLLAQALRAHGNFVEQAPLALILIAVAETTGARPMVILALGVALVVARLASAYALNRSLAQSSLRRLGGGLSVLILVAASAAILLALMKIV